MKLLCVAIAALLLLVGCAGNQNDSPGSRSKSAEQTTEPPVDLTFLGITPDRKNIAFKIAARGDKPIIQVDLGIREMDKSGKLLLETTLLWERRECCPRPPLEKGVVYDVQEPMVEKGAARSEATVERVHFQDGSNWAPK